MAKLDPGEAHNDVNGDGVVDPTGVPAHLPLRHEKRVAIEQQPVRRRAPDEHRLRRQRCQGPARPIFQSDIILPYTVSATLPVTPTVNTYRVIGVGDVITGVNGVVKDLQIGERLTKYGEIVIWDQDRRRDGGHSPGRPRCAGRSSYIPGLLGTSRSPETQFGTAFAACRAGACP